MRRIVRLNPCVTNAKIALPPCEFLDICAIQLRANQAQWMKQFIILANDEPVWTIPMHLILSLSVSTYDTMQTVTFPREILSAEPSWPGIYKGVARNVCAEITASIEIQYSLVICITTHAKIKHSYQFGNIYGFGSGIPIGAFIRTRAPLTCLKISSKTFIEYGSEFILFACSQEYQWQYTNKHRWEILPLRLPKDILGLIEQYLLAEYLYWVPLDPKHHWKKCPVLEIGASYELTIVSEPRALSTDYIGIYNLDIKGGRYIPGFI